MFSFAPDVKKIALAVSGGVDSMVMMDYAKNFAHQYEFHIFTVDHNFRAESKKETEIVANLAKQYGFIPHILTITEEKPKASAQEFARQKRYELFSQEAKELGIDLICLAHHKDDVYETLLSRLSHKSGLHGLSVMPKYFYSSGILFHRPMLEQRKSEIETYANQHNLTILEDPSNQTDIYERNRGRFYLKDNPEIIPSLEQLYQKAKLARTMTTIERDEYIQNHVHLSPLGYAIIQRQKIDNDIMLSVLRYGIMFVSGEAYINLDNIPDRNITVNHTYIHITKKQFILFRENRNLPNEHIITQGQSIIHDKRFKINSLKQGKLLFIPQEVKDLPIKIKIPLPCLKTESEIIDYKEMQWDYLPQGLESFNSDITLHHLAKKQWQGYEAE